MRFLPRSAKTFHVQKITVKKFPANIFSTADILMVDIVYGIERDSEDEEEYCLEDENTIDNPVDNALSGNVVIVYPSPEQSVTPGIHTRNNQ